jgi:uncharacterized membrane protein YuzA (DUF378 family)
MNNSEKILLSSYVLAIVGTLNLGISAVANYNVIANLVNPISVMFTSIIFGIIGMSGVILFKDMIERFG